MQSQEKFERLFVTLKFALLNSPSPDECVPFSFPPLSLYLSLSHSPKPGAGHAQISLAPTEFSFFFFLQMNSSLA